LRRRIAWLWVFLGIAAPALAQERTVLIEKFGYPL
jgi:hypothetical protein